MVIRPQTERGHEALFVRHFSIALPNRVGQLNELLAALETAEVEVAGLSIVDSADWAVIRVVFTDAGKAREALVKHQAVFTEGEVLAVVMPEPKALQAICKALVTAELNVHFAYPLMISHESHPVLVVNVDDPVLAMQVLTKHGFRLLDHEDVAGGQ